MKKAFILIDYTYDFVADDGKLTCGKPGAAIASAICEKLSEFKKSGEPVFVMSDLHVEGDVNHPETKLFPPHNIEGTKGRELYGAVKDAVDAFEKDAPDLLFRMDKTRYSSFVRTDLEKRLKDLDVDTVVLAGVCTDICVLHTAIGAYNAGFDIEVPVSCVASFSPEGHEFALSHMKNTLGAKVE